MIWAALLLLGLPASAAIDARADARVDLVGIIELLAGTRPPPTPLAERALRRFAAFAGHAAVARYKELRAKGFEGHVPTQYALYLTEPPELKAARRVPEFFSLKAGGATALRDFTEEMRRFAQDSGYVAWRREESAALDEPVRALAAALSRRDMEAPVVEFLGLKLWRRWTAVATAFYPWSYGSDWVIEETGDLAEIVSLVGARQTPQASEHLAQRLWPEALYAAAYALWALCAPRASLSPDICRGVRWTNEPENCAQQHWVRAMLAELMRSEFRAKSPWPVRRDLRRALARYQARRERYPDFLSAAELLWEPFLGRAASCRLPDPARYAEEVYARRLYYCALAKLQRAPGAEPWAGAARQLKAPVEAAAFSK